MPTLYRQVLSYNELVEECRAEEPKGKWALSGASSLQKRKSKREKERWDLGAGWRGALKIADYGWPEGREMMSEGLRVGSSDHLDIGAPEYTSDVVGQFPDIPEFLSGSPECMVDYDEEGMHPVISIGFTGCYPWFVTAQQQVNLGVAGLHLVGALERAGYAVEINVLFRFGPTSGSGSQDRMELDVVIKQPGEFVDLDRMAFALSHPAFLRRLVFRWMEQWEDAYDEFRSGMGSPLGPEPGEADILLPCPGDTVSGSPAAALRSVIEAAGDWITLDNG